MNWAVFCCIKFTYVFPYVLTESPCSSDVIVSALHFDKRRYDESSIHSFAKLGRCDFSMLLFLKFGGLNRRIAEHSRNFKSHIESSLLTTISSQEKFTLPICANEHARDIFVRTKNDKKILSVNLLFANLCVIFCPY